MKKDANLRMLLAAFCLFFGFSAVNAQSGNNDLINAKMEHQVNQLNDVDALYYQQAIEEEQKALLTGTNSVISENVTADGRLTYVIQLGWDLENEQAELDYESKVGQAAGIYVVDASHVYNTVSITIKEEDENNALLSLFDIQE